MKIVFIFVVSSKIVSKNQTEYIDEESEDSAGDDSEDSAGDDSGDYSGATSSLASSLIAAFGCAAAVAGVVIDSTEK